MLHSLPFLWQGLLVTLHVSALVVVISLVLGVVLGVGLSFGPWWVVWPVRLYSDMIRGLPLLVLIYSVYYMLPLTGWSVPSFWAAVSALAAFQTAHVIEVTRGAVQSIPHGQHEAGKAIGLGFGQRMIYVVMPQALRRFLPPWINTVVSTVQGSALVSLVGIVDLMF
jgi:polar amino acid transport system permease protein